jgi:CubicO group peptidase (beta-lactamase class C family)
MRWAWLSGMLVVGCSAGDPPMTLPAPVDGGVVVDAGALADASVHEDTGSSADANGFADTGGVADTGGFADGGGPTGLYFPPATGDAWETVDPATVGWDVALLEEALTYAESKSSTAIVILFRGRILVERYWNGWDLHRAEGIFSSSKSFTSTLIGLLLQDGSLQLDDPVIDYLGVGWTTAPVEKEALITVRHLLTMTSGLDDQLAYEADAGTTWYYNTNAYHQLFGVIAAASGMTRDQFAETRLHAPLGLRDTTWQPNRLTSSARDMARYGLFIQAHGSWDGTPILTHPTYLDEALSRSQDLNHGYGYLWWLNGQDSYLLPGPNPGVRTGPLMPDAPADVVGALGAGDKKIYVAPSAELVVVRHGGPTGEPALAASGFDNTFWQMLSAAGPF